MALTFHPKPGVVLVCDFAGYVAPEMIKRRPVVVVSPAHLRRPNLLAVVPLSTTPPDPIAPYHYRLSGNPVPGSDATEVWAKCDMPRRPPKVLHLWPPKLLHLTSGDLMH